MISPPPLAPFLGVHLFWFFFRRYIRSHDGELWWDEKKLKFPLIGSILERIALARFSRSFAMMLKAGVPILKCMTIVSESVGNRHIGRAVNTMATGVERGDRLTSTAAATGPRTTPSLSGRAGSSTTLTIAF